MNAEAVSSAITEFSLKFCNELDKDESVISSPLSAEFLLALLTLGSTDPAHSELLTSLGMPDDDSIRSSFSIVSDNLKELKDVTLNVANKLYIQDGPYELNPQLEEDAIEIFDAAIEKVDFCNGVSAVATINEWVESKTNNKIKDLLSEDSVDASTSLVFVNALYFKGTWKIQFDPVKTQDKPFYINSNSTVQVPMMYSEDTYALGLSQELNAKLLQLNYIDDEASLLIVLPIKIEGLNDMMAKLAAGYDLLSEIEEMEETKIRAIIPKFKIETEIDLKSLLPELGIDAIFNGNDSGLTKLLYNNEALFISAAVQKAYIEVNEEGAEAAAATGMTTGRIAVPQFYANRPFLYLLFDANQVPLFIGAYRGVS